MGWLPKIETNEDLHGVCSVARLAIGWVLEVVFIMIATYILIYIILPLTSNR